MRTWTWLVAALALPAVVPAAAGARGMQRQGLPPGPEETTDETGPTDAAGFLRGRVTAVDPAAGRVALDSAGQPVTLNGRPDDLDGLAPGSEVSLPFENFGGNLWVARGPPPGAPAPDAPGTPPARTVAGRVTALDKNEGRVSIDGTPFLAHPADLAGLSPGQAVRLRVEDRAGRSWVAPPAGGPGAR